MITESELSGRLTLAAIGLGLLLAFAGGLVSVAGHYYRLDALVLLAGMLPYTFLGILAGLVPGRVLATASAAVFAIHLAAVLATDPGSAVRATAPLLLLFIPLALLPRVRLSDSACKPNTTGGES